MVQRLGPALGIKWDFNLSVARLGEDLYVLKNDGAFTFENQF